MNALEFVAPPLRPWAPPPTTLAQPDTAIRLVPSRLDGLVELRASTSDPQSFVGFLGDNPAWPTVLTPYRPSVAIRSLATGKSIMHCTAFQADQPPRTPQDPLRSGQG